MYAAKLNQIEAVKALLDHGADVRARNGSLNTALHCAAISGNTEICRILLNSGADLRVKDEDGDTPLDVAKEADQHDACKCLEQAWLNMAERELRVAIESGDSRGLTTALERAEDENVVDPRSIDAAKDTLNALGKSQAQRTADSAVSEELAAAKRALADAQAAAEAASAASMRRTILAASVGAAFAVAVLLLAGIGARRQR